MNGLIRTNVVACLMGAASLTVCAVGADWPMLRSYEGECLRRVKLPLGGIGTGTVSLSGNGALVDWELRGQPAKGFTPSSEIKPCFLLRTETADGKVSLRLLNGPADTEDYEGEEGGRANNSGFPRFERAKFSAAYPLAQIDLFDEEVPVEVRLEAMNPLVKGDAESSGIPAALLRWRLKNPSAAPLKASVCGILIALGAEDLREKIAEGGLVGVRLAARDMQPVDDSLGELVLTVPEGAGDIGSTVRISVTDWKAGVDQFVRTFERTGRAEDMIDTEVSREFRKMAALSVSVEIPAGGAVAIPYALAWRYPHRRGWETRRGIPPGPFADACADVGNHYAVKFPSAFLAARRLLGDLPSLEAQTVDFVKGVLSREAPAVVKEAALFNLSTLRTETCFRTRDGDFCCWEGCRDRTGSCFGNCTHVWGYEHALIDIWPELAKNVTELQFGPAMKENGCMAFRMKLPVDRTKPGSSLGTGAAADGQMQCVIKAYENWRKTKDDGWIRRLYPRLRKAMEFCWLAGGWDADRDGVMEGCQHNTMDVDYYGPNPQMEFLYLAALKAMAELADFCGESEFANSCRDLVAKGSAWTEKNLFNGNYYEHRVVPMKATPLDGTRLVRQQNPDDPDYQLAAGCLVDQLVGDSASRHVGLGAVADDRHARRTLDTILIRNSNDYGNRHFNPMRTFAYRGEPALLMAWYPPDRLPRKPFPYYMESMTGFEYVVATALAQRGDFERAEAVVRNIRDRYDGRKRNPFDEAECGHHYGRALAAWSVLTDWRKR